MSQALGDRFTFPGTSLTVARAGFGAMQLPGEGVFGPPKDRAAAIAVLREAVKLGINHIDTSDFYGPRVANELIREALHPYPEHLVIVTKIGGKRGADKSWNPAYSREELIGAVHDNLRNLGLEALDVVNLRLGAGHGAAVPSLEEMLDTVIGLKRDGLIHNIGLSNVTPAEYATAKAMTEIVCVQNWYNVARRHDDAFVDELAAEGVAYVPFFPLGGFAPLQSQTLDDVAASLGATSRQVAQAWLLQRAPNILLIAGTSSVAHLRENAAAAALRLPPDALAALDAIDRQA
jgi:aryl-alcohol dehydrogenase-like predicted oxidoreductase